MAERKRFTLYSTKLDGSDLAVVDEDGNKIENLYEVSFHAQAAEIATLNLTMFAPGIKVNALLDGVTFVCPGCMHSFNHHCGDPDVEELL